MGKRGGKIHSWGEKFTKNIKTPYYRKKGKILSTKNLSEEDGKGTKQKGGI